MERPSASHMPERTDDAEKVLGAEPFRLIRSPWASYCMAHGRPLNIASIARKCDFTA